MLVFLFAQLFTNPPRHPSYRLVSGVLALVTLLWVLQSTLDYRMSIGDTFAFLAGGIAMLTGALEGGVNSRAVKHWSIQSN